MDAIRRALAGQERLWKVWWLWGALPNVFLKSCADAADRAIQNAPAGEDHALLALLALPLGYVCVWSFAAWRCAPNVSHPFWKWTARVMIVLAPLLGLIFYAAEQQQKREQPAAAQTQSTLDETQYAPAGKLQPPSKQPDSIANVSASQSSSVVARGGGDVPEGTTLYLDKHWHLATPPEPPVPDSMYLTYEGRSEIALFGATASSLAPDVFGTEFVRQLGGYKLTSVPKLLVLEGQNLWVVGLDSTDTLWHGSGMLYVFRDRRGNNWHVFAAGYPADADFVVHANTLAAACVRAAFS